jgi:hypothetical protein
MPNHVSDHLKRRIDDFAVMRSSSVSLLMGRSPAVLIMRMSTASASIVCEKANALAKTQQKISRDI